MQVLCKMSDTANDVQCSVCGQGFIVIWEEQLPADRDAAWTALKKRIADHHRMCLNSGAI